MFEITDPATGETVYVVTLDGIPDGWTSQEIDYPTLDMRKADKRAAVKALRQAKETATCSTPSGVVQIDDPSKIKINGLASMAMIANGQTPPAAFSVDFILADNSVATLDAAAAIAMSVAVGEYVSALYANSVMLFGLIAAAADAATLDAIDITAGWPSS